MRTLVSVRFRELNSVQLHDIGTNIFAFEVTDRIRRTTIQICRIVGGTYDNKYLKNTYSNPPQRRPLFTFDSFFLNRLDVLIEQKDTVLNKACFDFVECTKPLKSEVVKTKNISIKEIPKTGINGQQYLNVTHVTNERYKSVTKSYNMHMYIY